MTGERKDWPPSVEAAQRIVWTDAVGDEHVAPRADGELGLAGRGGGVDDDRFRVGAEQAGEEEGAEGERAGCHEGSPSQGETEPSGLDRR